MVVIQWDDSDARRFVAGVLKQVPFAASKALNRLGNEFQAAEREGIRDRFHVRRPWVLQTVKIRGADRAKKDRLAIVIRIDATRQGDKSTGGGILAKFEPGGEKHARGRSLAVPMPLAVPRTAAGIIQAKFRPKALALTKVGNTERGLEGTYVVPGVGIFRRIPGNASVLLYRFRESVPVPASLEFLATAARVVNDRYRAIFREELVAAIRSARV